MQTACNGQPKQTSFDTREFQYNKVSTVMADNLGVPTPTFNWEAPDLFQEFQEFQMTCEVILNGPFATKVAVEKFNYILLWMGRRGILMVKQWNLTQKKPENLFKRFQEHFQPQSNFGVEQHKFHLMQQREDSVDEFINKLQNQAKLCKFPDQYRSQLILQKFISGLHTRDVQKILLLKDDSLTLEDAVKIAKTHEATKKHLDSLNPQEQQADICAVQTRNMRQCWACLKTHPREGPCLAKTTACVICKRKGHWKGSRYCKKKVEEITTEQADNLSPDADVCELIQELHFDMVSSQNTDEIYATLQLPQYCASLRVKIDSGAQANLMPTRVFKALFLQTDVSKLPQSAVKLSSVTGLIPQRGQIEIQMQFQNRLHADVFHICDTNRPPLLGLKAARQLGLITVNPAIMEVTVKPELRDIQSVEKEFPEVFHGLGKFDEKFHIELQQEATPIIHPQGDAQYISSQKLKNISKKWRN